ncbi:hypothetical protein [Mycobacterium sp.]|uniref:hypothetical protein n=1 Tax=Mycobacterium sp. TaxID=1785 RepID=UPI0031D320AD
MLHSNSSGDAKNTTTSTAASDIASANDKGPVTVITQDPSCSAWEAIGKAFATSTHNGWGQRDPSIPATAWTPEQRSQYEAVGQAMRTAADQTVPLAKLTPHRVMRELYEQFIAYAREYADHISNYAPPDDRLAGVANSTASALGAICDSVAFDAAARRGPLVSPSLQPSQTASPGDLANPQRFLTSANIVCKDWSSAYLQFDDETETFRSQNLNIPASQWTPDQTSASQAAASKMTAFADKADQLGQRSGNPELEDFAALSAQYYRAFVVAVPSYVLADSYLEAAGAYSALTIRAACQVVGD